MFKRLSYIFGSKTKAQEIVMLLNNLKPVVRQGFYESELVKVNKYCSENGLFLVKSRFKVLLDAEGLDEERKMSLIYSNKGLRIPEDDQRAGMFFVYISKNEEKAYLASYYELVGNDSDLGLLLGYPKCCTEFFCNKFSAKNTNLELDAVNAFTNLSKRDEDCVILSHFPCNPSLTVR